MDKVSRRGSRGMYRHNGRLDVRYGGTLTRDEFAVLEKIEQASPTAVVVDPPLDSIAAELCRDNYIWNSGFQGMKSIPAYQLTGLGAKILRLVRRLVDV